jgi:uncharacterized coiled-coil protein SlyX
MRRPRFQFRLSTLLWITLAVAAYLGGRSGGRAVQRQEDEQRMLELENQIAVIAEANAVVLQSQAKLERRQNQLDFLAAQIEKAEAGEREMIQKARDFISSLKEQKAVASPPTE